jgi:F-type H+-transporting ATPase subunit gamma
MRQLTEISKERESMEVVVELTSAFEGIASLRIAQIKDLVQSSEKFFGELWRIYKQIRVDELFHFGRGQSVAQVVEKELLILITAEGSFTGDVDQRIIKEALSNYNSAKNDVVVIGHHGTVQLAQAGIEFVRSFKLPDNDKNINVMPIVAIVQKYASASVYYPAYVSLTSQKVKKIQLDNAVAERGDSVKMGGDIISEDNYIFEPSTYEVVDHLERSMMQITLSEVILESKLAQYASRFKAMSAAHSKADESFSDLNTLLHKARRQLKDERLKEIINSLRSLEQ